jgi:iron complex transport system ATP-binding protein
LNQMLEVKDLHFSYSSPVLTAISFAVEAGQLLVVLGPNGSGKSTLIKIIIGILTPNRGEVRLDGKPLSSMRRKESAKLIGYVAQESAIRFPLTVMEFVLQGRFAQGRMIGFESDRDVLEAERAMELTGTAVFAARPVTQLSGGERQRVMLARALAIQPRVLVLDEPVANLDVSHQVKMLELVKRQTSEGAIGVVVTHELNLAAEFATHVLLMKSGEMIACGEPGDVMNERLLREVFDADLIVDENPISAAPRVTLIAPASGSIHRPA